MIDRKRRELGDFLRARRGRLSPEAVGLTRHRQRRTPGLRREEVAELAGIGVDWYIRLEQGRPVTPSLGTVEALARALRLTDLEHQHLRALAGGGGHKPFEPEIAPPSLLRLLESLVQPAYVVGRRRDLVAWNAQANDIFGFDELEDGDRNILVSMLTNLRSRALFGAAGPRRRSAWSPSSAPPTISWPTIRRSCRCYAVCARSVWSSTAGGSVTTSATRSPAAKRYTTPQGA